MITLAAALALTLAAAGPTAEAEPTLRVRVGDIDFAQREDVRRFDVRLVGAAKSFCEDNGSTVLSRTGGAGLCADAMRREVLNQLPARDWRGYMRHRDRDRRAVAIAAARVDQP